MSNEIIDFIKSGSISSMCFGLFYPLEIAKLRLQSNKKLQIPLNTYYRGLGKSLLFVFPEKGIKFSTFNYCQNNKYNFNKSIFITTILQSIISTPTEYYRINKQFRSVNFINKNLYRGYPLTIIRDFVFNYIFFKKSYQKTNFYENLLGGVMATSLATPFDVIKTNYQKGDSFKNIINKIKLNPFYLLGGIIPRTLSLGCFYGLTYFIYQNLT